MNEVSRFKSPQEMAEASAQEVLRAARNALSARGRFLLVLCGGRSPAGLYARLAEEPFADGIDWSRTHVFFGDERAVGPESAQSNFRLADDSLLSRVPIPPENVRRITGEIDTETAARLYDAEIRRAGHGEAPRFDLVLLGLGADGHTASLFPGARALDELRALALPSTSPSEPRHRVTMTLPVLNAAREVLFLVAGQDKEEALTKVLQEGCDLPAARVRPADGVVRWFVTTRNTPSTRTHASCAEC